MNTRRSFVATCLTAGAASQLPNLSEPTSEPMDDSNYNRAPSKQEQFVGLAASMTQDVLAHRRELLNWRSLNMTNIFREGSPPGPDSSELACAREACEMAKLILSEAAKI